MLAWSHTVLAGSADFSGSWSFNISGDTVRIEVDRITNNSSRTTDPLYLTLWLTTGPNPYTRGYPTARFALADLDGIDDGRLAPGYYVSNLWVTATFSRPPAGTYYVHLFVSEYPDLNLALDLVTARNTLTIGGGDPLTSPDLVVESPSVSKANLEQGESFTLEARVRNRGDGAAGATTLRYYRSADSAISTSDEYAGSDRVGSLSAQATSTETIRVSAPNQAGTYYYGACVDSVAGESNTGNNCSSGVRVVVTENDDHGDSRSQASRVGPNSDTTGRLERQGDLDYFRFELPSRAAVTVETTGDTDTQGRLEDGSGVAIASDDDEGVDRNFRIRRTLDAGTYYARVTGFGSATGAYALRIRHTPEGGDGGGAGDQVEQRYSVPLLQAGVGYYLGGALRVINHSNRLGTVRIHAIDDAGTRKAPIELYLLETSWEEFGSDDLERSATGLSDGIGDGVGDWRLDLITDLDIEPLAYTDISKGYAASMSRTAARLRDGRYHIPFFNPASNVELASSLRLINPRDGDVEVTISGLDDRGMVPPSGDVRLTLRPRESRTVTARELESGGAGLRGRFGDGSGKWRLFVSASRPIQAMSLLKSPTGLVANLSARGRTGWLPLLPPASNREREGLVRVINHSRQSGVVHIRAIDDAGRERGPITLSLDARATAHFTSDDLETGNAARGLSGGVGSGRGNWRLELESGLNIEALAYIRAGGGFVTNVYAVAEEIGGFVTSMYGVAEEVDGAIRIPLFRPRYNGNPNIGQASRLRLINRGGDDAAVTIYQDNWGPADPGEVRLTLRAGESRTITGQELESGGTGLSGRIRATYQHRLTIRADRPILAMSLLEGPAGILTNLSPGGGGAVGPVSDGGGGGDGFIEDQLEDFDIAIPGSCAREVDVCVRDHLCEDGDEVRVTVNGEIVFSGELFNAPECVTVPVMAGRNTIELRALNGTGFKGYCSHIDVNTGQIDVTGGNEQTQTWMHRGGAGSSANLNVTIGPDGPCRPDPGDGGGPGDGGDPGDGNDTRDGATSIAPGVAADGTLDGPDDVDYWRIDIPSRGRVVIESTGNTDTLGRLEGASGGQLAENDDGGAGLNFKIERVLEAGTYYVRVSGSGGATGGYSLRVSHTPDDTGGGGGGAVNFVGTNGGNVSVSHDGVHWELIDDFQSFSSVGGTLAGVAYGDGLWMIVGSRQIHTSADGRNWTGTLYDEDILPGYAEFRHLEAVAYARGRWVAANGRAIITSTDDGRNWTNVSASSNLGVLNIGGPADIHYGNGLWVILGAHEILESSNGTGWTFVPRDKLTTINIPLCGGDPGGGGVVFADGHWYKSRPARGGRPGGDARRIPIVCTRTVEGNWVPFIRLNSDSNDTEGNYGQDIGYGDGNWVAAGTTGIATWRTGVNEWHRVKWSEFVPEEDLWRNIEIFNRNVAVAYRDGLWIVAAEDGNSYNTGDPKNVADWTYVPHPYVRRGKPAEQVHLGIAAKP